MAKNGGIGDSKLDQVREPAEIRHANQIEALKQNDPDTPPKPWLLSPRSVLTYIVGGKTLKAKIDGKNVDVPITRKFFGDDAIVERFYCHPGV